MSTFDENTIRLKLTKVNAEPRGVHYKFPKALIQDGEDFDMVTNAAEMLLDCDVDVVTEKRFVIFTKKRKDEES